MATEIVTASTVGSATPALQINSQPEETTGNLIFSSTKSVIDKIKLSPPGQYRDWDEHMRQQWELMYAMPVNIQHQGSWAASERYWQRKDVEMLEYLQDWPTSRWLIDQKDARAAYEDMQKRWRLRDQGKSVYVDGVPQYWSYGKPDLTYRPPSPKTAPQVKPTNTGPKQARKAAAAAAAKASVSSKASAAAKTKNESSNSQGQSGRPKRSTRASLANGYAERPEEFDTPQPYYEIIPPVTKVPRKYTFKNGAGSGKGKRKEKTPEDSAIIDDPNMAVDDDYAPPPPKKRKMRKSTGTSEAVTFEAKLKTVAMEPPPYDRDNIIAGDKSHEDFPWQNEYAAEDPEAWDDSIYEPSRLEHLHSIHTRNSRIVSKFMENGKNGAQKRKSAAQAEALKFEQEEEDTIIVGSSKICARKPDKKRPKIKRPRTTEQREHFSGRLEFADAEEERKFKALNFESVEEAIEAAMRDPFNKELQNIEVAHDPGDSILSDLEIPRISIMDIARTRLQLGTLRIMTDRAVECLVDFCPDLLNSYTLLQVVSETKFGNTGVQVRLGQNGSMLSDSTITKRVSAALNREYDKSAAAEALKKDPEFKKTNRDNYEKYKRWRAIRRSKNGFKPSTFDLTAAAAAHAAKVPSAASPEVKPIKMKIKVARRSKRKASIKNEDEEETQLIDDDAIMENASQTSSAHGQFSGSGLLSTQSDHGRTSSGSSIGVNGTALQGVIKLEAPDVNIVAPTLPTQGVVAEKAFVGAEAAEITATDAANRVVPENATDAVPAMAQDDMLDNITLSEARSTEGRPQRSGSKKRPRESSSQATRGTLDAWLGGKDEPAAKRRSIRKPRFDDD